MCSVAMAEGVHPIPFRTRKLSPPAPMVLRRRPWESRTSLNTSDGSGMSFGAIPMSAMRLTACVLLESAEPPGPVCGGPMVSLVRKRGLPEGRLERRDP